MTDRHDPTEDLDPTVDQVQPASGAGRIGPYALRQKIGEGGMGEVWLAEQEAPIRRRVAVKVIKLGMDSRQVAARFEAERQALAMMDHPAIARIFDAGTTPEGRPYFVMEHVKGVPVTEYCDRHKLSNRERLELFVQICEGVQHAHQKAVIHRDLKPGNVLVAVADDRPQPKIIDFGVAKATDRRLTESTLHTHLGAMVGTPAYMSPEQAEMSGLDVDTRADVYSLGVMLYELLAGALPFDMAALQAAGYEGMVRKIREEEPPRPSTRLTSLGPASTEVAARRRTELPALRRELAGDLDWIAMKALEKDRTRRYGSPQDLAADIRRYLDDEPVLACPPSAAYRARKFVRRHAAGVVAAAAAVLVLAGFAGTMTVQARRLAVERDAAERARENLEKVVVFQADMLGSVDAESMGRLLLDEMSRRVKNARLADGADAAGAAEAVRELRALLRDVSATDLASGLLDQEILARAVRTLDEEYADQPLIDARLRLTIGRTYRLFDLPGTARPLVERAIEIFRRELGDRDRTTLLALKELGLVEGFDRQYPRAVELYQEALDGFAQAFGRDDADYLETMGDLGESLYRVHRYAESDSLTRLALAEEMRLHGPDHEPTVAAMLRLGRSCMRLDRFAEADSILALTIAASERVLGLDDPETWEAYNMRGVNFYRQQDMEGASRYMGQALAASERFLGPDHVETTNFRYNMAAVNSQMERWDEAERLYHQCIASYRRQFGDEGFRTLDARENLATTIWNAGRPDEARVMFTEILELRRELQGPENIDTLDVLEGIAELDIEQGRHEQADPVLRDILRIYRERYADRPLLRLYPLKYLRESLRDRGLHAEASPVYAEFAQICREHYGIEDDYAQSAVLAFARNAALAGDAEGALAALREIVAAGYAEADGLATDEELESLRGAEFEALVERARGNAGADSS